jgi:hypothetical protein
MQRTVAGACFALAAMLVLVALLGPLLTGTIEYRYTETYENQVIGLDAFALIVAAPLLLAACALTLSGRALGPLLALGPALMAAYMAPQYVLGAHYDAIPGNNEDYFLLFVALFIVAAGTAIAAWRATAREALPPWPARRRRWVALLLFGVAAFLIARYVPILADIWAGEPGDEYEGDPIAFWLIAFLDLSVALPAAVVAAVAAFRGAPGVTTLMLAVVGWFALVGPAVAAMAIAMAARDDPHASTGGAVAFIVFSVVFVAVAAVVYWPLRGVRAGGAPEGR